MIIYNVTIKVQHSISEQWLQWLMQIHIVEIMNTKCFEKYTLLKLLEVDESEGSTYAIQYFAKDMATYNLYISKYAQKLREASFAKWGNNFIAFRTVMQIIS